jgi:Dolichyl-phosphate-mannose-protein mannosyltransferase
VTNSSMARPTSERFSAGDLAWPAAIVAIGLVTRLAFVWDFAGHPVGKLPWVDEGAYWTRASAILGGAWLPDRPFFQDPLYPYFLAVLMRIGGGEVANLRVMLACIGALTPLVVYWAGRLGLGRAEAIVAGALTAVYRPLIFTDGLLEKEGVAALGAATALGLTAFALTGTTRTWRIAIVGFAWGMVALLRANALALAPLGALWWALVGSRGATVGSRIRLAMVYLAGFALAIAPVTFVNVVVSRPRELILTTWQGGPNFYIGNGPEATGTYAAPEFVEANPAREADDFAREASRRAGRPLSCVQVSRFWTSEGLRRWRDAPLASLRLLGRKLALVTHDFEIPDNHDIEVVKTIAAPRLAWGILSFGGLLPLAALGLGRSERSPFWSFLILSTATGLATTALFFVVGRYRIPWAPGLALLGTAGVVDLSRRIARRDIRGVCWRIVLLAAPAAMIGLRPSPDPTPDRWSHAEIVLALAYLSEGRIEPAIDAFDDARALGAGPASRVALLMASGPVHDRLASLVQSQTELSRSSRGVSPLEHARWLRQFPETRSASLQELESLIRSQPTSAGALRELGAWQLGEAEDADAVERAKTSLARACRTSAGDPSAAILLALLETDPRWLAVRTATRADDQERSRLAHAIVRSRSAQSGRWRFIR